MKKLVFILSAMLLLIGTMDVQAQWGKKLLKKAGESAKRATERNVERKVEQTVDKAFEGAEDVVTGKGNIIMKRRSHQQVQIHKGILKLWMMGKIWHSRNSNNHSNHSK